MKRERRDLRAAGKPEKVLRRGAFDSDFTALIFPPLACQNFPETEMISQASCVFVCAAAAAAAGAALLGVVDRDNVALWLELTTTESAAEACSTTGRKREGRRGLNLLVR